MKPFLLSALSLLCASSAFAQSTASIACSGGVAMVTITTTPASSHVGLPGAFAYGVSDPSETGAAYLTQSGWTIPNGPIEWYASYREGVPPILTVSTCVPDSSLTSCAATTTNFVGYKVGATYGVLDTTGRALMQSRRQTLDKNKADMVARGRWMPMHEDDEYFAEAYVGGFAMKTIQHVLTIPFLDCTPPEFGK